MRTEEDLSDLATEFVSGVRNGGPAIELANMVLTQIDDEYELFRVAYSITTTAATAMRTECPCGRDHTDPATFPASFSVFDQVTGLRVDPESTPAQIVRAGRFISCAINADEATCRALWTLPCTLAEANMFLGAVFLAAAQLCRSAFPGPSGAR